MEAHLLGIVMCKQLHTHIIHVYFGIPKCDLFCVRVRLWNIHASIHPFIHHLPIWDGQSRVFQTSLPRATLFKPSWGIPRLDGIYSIISPSSSGSTMGCLSWACLEDLQREMSRKYPKQMPKPSQLALFDAKDHWLSSKLPQDIWTPHPISRTKPSRPPEETHFSHLYLWSHYFGH